MTVADTALLDVLKAVIDPNTGKDFVSSKQLKNLRINGGMVSFDVELGYPAKSQIASLTAALTLVLTLTVVRRTAATGGTTT